MNFLSNNSSNNNDNDDNNNDNNDNDERNELTLFWISFNNECNSIRSLLEQLDNDSNSNSEKEKDDIILSLKQRTVSLQVYATASTRLMPPYDIRRTQEEIEKLNKSIKDVEAKVKPKKKFTFASRNKTKEKDAITAITAPTTTSTNTTIVEDTSMKLVPKELPGSYTIINKDNETISLTSTELTFNDNVRAQLFIKNCSNCTISARSLLGSVRLENVNNSNIILGPCCTSVYLEDCNNNIIHIACHQLRIHKSNNCKLFVKCNSHPIIEDCSSMGFGPYFAKYNNINNDIITSSLHNATCWSNVVDFRWHRNTQSPNWYILLLKDIININNDIELFISKQWDFDVDYLKKILNNDDKVNDQISNNDLKLTANDQHDGDEDEV